MKGREKAVTEFLAESEDILEDIGNLLTQLEMDHKTAQVHPEVVNSIFRGAHSLKGLSGMLGFSKVSELSHHLENMLDALRLGKVELSGSLLDCLFASLEALNAIVAQIGASGNDEWDIAPAMAQINAVLQGDPVHGGGAGSPVLRLDLPERIREVLTEYEEHRLQANVEKRAHILEISASFSLLTFDRDLQALSTTLSEIGEIITTLPSSGAAPEAAIAFNLVVGTQKIKAEVEKSVASYDATVTEIEYVTPKASPAPPLPAPEKLPETPVEPISFGKDVKGLTRTVRVDIQKLDALMNVVGELIQSKNILRGSVREMKKAEGLSQLTEELQKPLDTLERKLAELQDGVLDVRMIPIGQIFNRLSRIVRKLSKESKKEIAFVTHGEDTELDKMVIEEIADPLMHIIRNAIDHGIESPEERRGSGKPPVGTLELRAYQKGSHVVVDIEDDGDGIDLGKILTKGLEKGLVAGDDILDEGQILNLIFMPGLSTAKEVSEVSGRGVGMDVVKKNIGALGGMIDIETEVGKGTCFTISLPITLAIMPALLIACSGQIYAIPLNAVSETLIVSGDEIDTIENNEMIKLRDRILPLLRLQEIFGLPAGNGKSGENKFHVVVVGLAENKIGIVVDDFVDKQEIVIKPIGEILKTMPGIAGATELGNKRAILVLDVGSLIEEATQGVAIA